MSNICVFNLHHTLNYDELNALANRLVKISLKDNIGVIFHSNYAQSMTCNYQFKNYFYLSDSFLHCNSNFLDFPIGYNLSNIEYCKKEFISRYGFFNDIIEELKKSHISKIDIYLSSDGAVDDLKDFTSKVSTHETFLSDLFNQIIESADEYAYCVPSVCYTIVL